MLTSEPPGHSGVDDGSEPAPESLDPDAVDALMATSKLLTAVVAHSLADAHASVTTPQLRVLVMLRSQGHLNLAGVAGGLGVNASNASRTCEQLVTVGLVSRRPDPADRRNLILDLTPEGVGLVERLMDLRRHLFQRIVDTMPRAERRALSSSLEMFLRAANEVATSDVVADADGHLLRWLA